MALVIVLNEAGVFSAKLGGITGPGSRPKKDRNRAFLITGLVMMISPFTSSEVPISTIS